MNVVRPRVICLRMFEALLESGEVSSEEEP
jgi:hypothetical protein